MKTSRKTYLNFLQISITALRPYQWYKNILIFAGVVFSANITNWSMIYTACLGFISFCLLSGSEYIINDLIDREQDRIHPVKCRRPIASGSLKTSQIVPILVLLILLFLVLDYLVNTTFLFISLGYFFLIILYSLKLKHIIILDILVISSGFVIRAIAGCIAINVSISPWLILCTFLLALFLAIGKRRNELSLLIGNASAHRYSLNGYSISVLEQFLNITSASVIVAYMLYTFHTDNYYLMFTIPFPIYGIFRYLILIHKDGFGGEPEKLFTDKALLINLVLWVISILIILYLSHTSLITF
jgi:4-hydroxybenzoate polyprenyltransferase